MISKKIIIYAFLALLVIALFAFTHHRALTWNDRSRLDTVQALVEQHTFVIDNTIFPTGDKVFINGHFYSDKPPVLSVALAGVYAVLYVFGITFAAHPSIVIYCLTFFVAAVPLGIFAWFLAQAIKEKTTLSPEMSLLLVGVFIAGTWLFPYGTILNNHLIAAVLAGIAILRIYTNHDQTPAELGLIALLFGFGGVIDLSSIFIAIIFSLLLLVKHRQHTKRWLIAGWYAMGAIIPLTIHWLINRAITGDIKPASMHPEFFMYPGSTFTPDTLTNATVNNHWLHYGILMIAGERGLLSLCPVLIVALGYAAYRSSKKQAGRGLWIAILLSFVAVVGYYALYGKDYGGPTYGVRWLVVVVPVLLLPLIELIKERPGSRQIVIALALIGALWNIPAAPSVFANLNGYNTVQQWSVYQRFTTSLHQEWPR